MKAMSEKGTPTYYEHTIHTDDEVTDGILKTVGRIKGVHSVYERGRYSFVVYVARMFDDDEVVNRVIEFLGKA